MNLLSRIKDSLADFLFPKRDRVIELETLSADKLIELLPPAREPRDKSVLALFDYSHPLVKEIIWEIKYKGNTKLAETLGTILYDVILNELAEKNLFEKWGQPLIVPVPMSDKRRFERGWNQAELLAESLVSHDKSHSLKYLPRQLVKMRHTESQTTTSSRSERLKNLENSMKVLNAQKVEEKSVILVDDVTTTGSTFAEAGRALKEAGAKKVLCPALAH